MTTAKARRVTMANTSPSDRTPSESSCRGLARLASSDSPIRAIRALSVWGALRSTDGRGTIRGFRGSVRLGGEKGRRKEFRRKIAEEVMAVPLFHVTRMCRRYVPGRACAQSITPGPARNVVVRRRTVPEKAGKLYFKEPCGARYLLLCGLTNRGGEIEFLGQIPSSTRAIV